jgi:hypothetical protein
MDPDSKLNIINSITPGVTNFPVSDLTWDQFIYPRGGKSEKTINAYVEALAIGALNFLQSRFKGSSTIQMAMKQPKRL